MSTQKKGSKRKATEEIDEPKAKRAKAASDLKAKRAKGETSLKDDLKWEHVGVPIKSVSPVIVLSSATLPGLQKVAGFDIDFTVIKTASGKKFATGARDWEWWDDKVPDKLKDLDKKGFRVVFFTNQAGIEKNKVKSEQLTVKIENIIKKLGIPIFAFICTGENLYRKPNTSMWDLFEEKYNKGVKVNRKQSIFVGDAAGRAKNWAPGKPKDFSCSDRKFAANLGVKFQTPEEFFLGKAPVKFQWLSADPQKILKKATPVGPLEYHKKSQEMVVMVGCPASGKSTLRKKYLEPHGYVAVNRDTMGTFEKCCKVAVEALANGKSVVADNTNPSVAARKMFITRAQKEGVPCRCFIMGTSVELAHHMNYVRQTLTEGKIRRIPDIAYNMYKSQYEPPSLAEGFTEILNIDFVPQFDTKKDEEIFKQWT